MIRRPFSACLWLAALVLLLLLAGCDQPPLLQSGDPAPVFVLTDLDGQRVDFPDQFRGQPVVIGFWAGWCPSCRRELKLVDEILREQPPNRPVFLAVNIAQDRETAARFIQEIGVGFGSLLDTDADVASRYREFGLPTTSFIGADGHIQSKILGAANRAIFERMLAGILAQPNDS